jgi:putative SOS response-associated peptidase YedK
MCGRYTLSTTNPADVAGRLGLAAASFPAEALGRANVCPTEDVLAVVADPEGTRRPAMLRWGLAPSWATLKGMRPLINARDDSCARAARGGRWRRTPRTAA